ncbi:unnamed protein product [Vitrella brassicaformis CCMP3155]|uniref:Uncharacterized protein n=2 Tax=Vitrella brassicaformis TaxID=1169539 RepID=A0A0G4F9J4_VITBC|nr:unnamed protein product [Vitrella brassicaformis CCMP3155]|mmetsp:Transcript_18375/g.52461  ORF Transcript_18375/g.52461 Transcript_18375/m.52461 type:complete len:254 (+) Transcript_18375:1739-2500(+)|eukprot:CEM09446.1 unnamed protein product [Vitrella brassicaformis CCMP3155]
MQILGLIGTILAFCAAILMIAAMATDHWRANRVEVANSDDEVFQAYGLTHSVVGFTAKATYDNCHDDSIAGVDSTFTCLQKDGYLVKDKSLDACVCRSSYEDQRDYKQYHDQVHHDCSAGNWDDCKALQRSINGGYTMVSLGTFGVALLLVGAIGGVLGLLGNDKLAVFIPFSYIGALIFFFVGIMVWGILTDGSRSEYPSCFDKDGERIVCPLDYSSIIAIVAIFLTLICAILAFLPMMGKMQGGKTAIISS